MSGEKQEEQPSVVNENFIPQSESSAASEANQVEEDVSSSKVERENQYFPLDSQVAQLPNFDLVLSQVINSKANCLAAPNTVEDQMAVFEKFSSQMEELESFIEGMGCVISPERYEASADAEDQVTVSENTFDEKPASREAAKDQMEVFEKTSKKKADLGNFMEHMGIVISPVCYVASEGVAAKKAASEEAADKMATSRDAADKISLGYADDNIATSGDAYDKIAASDNENKVSREAASGCASNYMEASVSYDLSPKTNARFKDVVRSRFGRMFEEGSRLQDIYGITDICAQTLLETYNRLLYRMYNHRIMELQKDELLDPVPMMADALVVELKRLYSMYYVFDLLLEGDMDDYEKLNPSYEETPRMLNASIILGFTMLAFAERLTKARIDKTEILEKTLIKLGIPLAHDNMFPDHPIVTHWLCIIKFIEEMNRYMEVFKCAIDCLNESWFFSTNDA